MQSNGEDDCPTIPGWLDQSFLEPALGNYLDDKVVIESFAVEPATGKGENFASSMFRVKAIYSSEKEPNHQKAFVCIVKVPYESGLGHDLLTLLDVYRKELDIYEMILPKLKAQLMQSGIDADIVADTVHVCHQHKSIVFEDLSLRGYRMPARCDGLDMAHTKILLRQLAVFHATCALLHEKDENIYTHFKHGMMNRNDSAFETFYTTSFDALTAQISTWPAFDGYVAKLKRIRPQLMERGRRSFDPIPGQFNTLIHGDIWVNNTMYTYDATTGQPDRMMLVDFQFCCWASPTVDLHYFFNTSVQSDLRLHRQTEMLHHYHGALVDTLTRLRFRGAIPTMCSLQQDFMQTSFYGFIAGSLVQPIMLNENSEDADIAALHGNDERALRYKAMMFTNPKVQENLRALLPVWDRNGLFD